MTRRWLEDLRKNENLTQQQVADSAGFSRAYYTMIENGTRSPSVKIAIQIANVLKFDWTIFFTQKCNETKHIGNEVVA